MARLIFDLDGTLLDSAPALLKAGNALLKDLGRTPVDLETYKGFVGRGMRVQVESLLMHTGGIPKQGLEASLARFMVHYKADPIAGTQPFPGVVDALAVLAPAHRMGVATQKPEAPARDILAAFGLDHFFEAVTGGDTLGILKPDPQMILHTAAALGQGQILFVGDSSVDRQTARNAGVPFILHEKGYRKESVIELAPDASFDHFDLLPRAIEGVLERTA